MEYGYGYSDNIESALYRMDKNVPPVTDVEIIKELFNKDPYHTIQELNQYNELRDYFSRVCGLTYDIKFNPPPFVPVAEEVKKPLRKRGVSEEEITFDTPPIEQNTFRPNRQQPETIIPNPTEINWDANSIERIQQMLRDQVLR